MKREELFEAFEGIDEERLEDSERKVKKIPWRKWCGFAAGFCMLIAAAITTPQVFPRTFGREVPQQEMAAAGAAGAAQESSPEVKAGNVADTASGAVFGETSEAVPDDVSGKTAGRASGGASGQTKADVSITAAGSTSGTASGEASEKSALTSGDNGNIAQGMADTASGFQLNGAVYFPISYEERQRFGLPAGVAADSDLGEVIGVIEANEDTGLNGCTVYRFSRYPDNDALCIVDKNGSYEIYYSSSLILPDGIGQNFDDVLKAYGMPDSVTEIEVKDGKGQELSVIKDKETIKEICELLSDRTNIGLEANERRFAALWKETYGNESVYYNGQNMVYDGSGDFMENYEKAHKLWGQGERTLLFITERGFCFELLYKPSIGTFECHGFYPMTDKEVCEMNTLLGIDEME